MSAQEAKPSLLSVTSFIQTILTLLLLALSSCPPQIVCASACGAPSGVCGDVCANVQVFLVAGLELWSSVFSLCLHRKLLAAVQLFSSFSFVSLRTQEAQ